MRFIAIALFIFVIVYLYVEVKYYKLAAARLTKEAAYLHSDAFRRVMIKTRQTERAAVNRRQHQRVEQARIDEAKWRLLLVVDVFVCLGCLALGAVASYLAMQ